jgi:predicted Zn-dependent protease
MTKGVLWTFGILRLISRGLSVVSAQAPQQLSSADKIRAGDALFVLCRLSQGFADTPESKAIEAYLQKIGDKSRPNAHRKPPYKFPLDPHPGFRSAVGYPGGQIVVGSGILALMSHEDELAVVLGHETEHIDPTQCPQRLTDEVKKKHISPDQFDKLSIDDFGNPYGKDAELAADRKSLKPAVVAGYSPHAAVESLEVFQFVFPRLEAQPAV